MSETTLDPEAVVATPKVGTPCPRCSEPRIGDYADHLCQDLAKNLDFNPHKIEIDVDNIEILLKKCQALNMYFMDLLDVTFDELTETRIKEFQARISTCEDTLQKLCAYYAPYRLNEWDIKISQLEAACRNLEQRTFDLKLPK